MEIFYQYLKMVHVINLTVLTIMNFLKLIFDQILFKYILIDPKGL